MNGELVVSARRRTSRQTNFRPRLRISAPGSRPALHQNLEAVADAEHEPAIGGELAHRRHHGRELGDGAAAQVVAVGEAAGQDHGIDVAERGRIMPDEFRRLAEIVGDRVPSVVIAIAAGKDNDAKFHGFCFRGGSSLYFTRGGRRAACGSRHAVARAAQVGLQKGFSHKRKVVVKDVLNYVLCAHLPASPPACSSF